jgi:hypothetical protein
MTSVLGQAISETRQNWQAAVRTFWSVALVGALVNLAAARRSWPGDSTSEQLNFLGIATGILTLLLLLVASSAAVTWHRRLILGEERGWVLPWPRRYTFSYAILVIGFGIIYFLILLPAVVLREGVYAALFGEIGAVGALAWHQYLLGFGPIGRVLFALPAIVAELVVIALFLLLRARAMLALPTIAVGEDRLAFVGKALKWRMGVALLAAYAVPVMFAGVLDLIVTVVVDEHWGFPEQAAFMFATGAAALAGFVLSLSVLSVSYRANLMELESAREA